MGNCLRKYCKEQSKQAYAVIYRLRDSALERAGETDDHIRKYLCYWDHQQICFIGKSLWLAEEEAKRAIEAEPDPPAPGRPRLIAIYLVRFELDKPIEEGLIKKRFGSMIPLKKRLLMAVSGAFIVMVNGGCK